MEPIAGRLAAIEEHLAPTECARSRHGWHEHALPSTFETCASATISCGGQHFSSIEVDAMIFGQRADIDHRAGFAAIICHGTMFE